MFGDFNIPLCTIDQTSKRKISKNIKDLNKPINQLDLIYIFRTFHPTISNSRVHILLKCTQNIYQNRPYSGLLKKCLNKSKRI